VPVVPLQRIVPCIKLSPATLRYVIRMFVNHNLESNIFLGDNRRNESDLFQFFLGENRTLIMCLVKGFFGFCQECNNLESNIFSGDNRTVVGIGCRYSSC
jgi:hypothetical protein